MTNRGPDPSRRPLRVTVSRARYEPVDAHDIDPFEFLRLVAGLRLRAWRCGSTDSMPGRHLAPVAEAFYDRFELGRGPTRVPAAAVDGVALAAIQGLQALLDRQAQVLDRQADRLADQRDDIEALREHVEALHVELARLR